MSADDWSGLMDMTAARRRNTTLLSTTLWFNAVAFYVHLGVAGHGEGVEAVGDHSHPGSDQGPVETGARVRLRTTRRDNDQNPAPAMTSPLAMYPPCPVVAQDRWNRL